MKDFSVTLSFMPSQLADVLCSALEGGSNYWYHIMEVIEPLSWEFESDPIREDGGHWFQDYPFNPGGALLIADREDPHYEPMRLDREAIQKGLEVMAEQHPKHLADILDDNADAETGDVLLQCSLFGSVILG